MATEQLTQEQKLKVKNQNIEEIQWQQRVDILKVTHENLYRQKGQLEEEMNRKRADFDNYIASKDAQYKKDHESLVAERAVLTQQREEFKKILGQHEVDKSNIAQAKMDIQTERAKVDDARSRVDQFVIALQKAYSLIG